MTLVRYRPMMDLFNARDEMNRLFDGIFRGVSPETDRFGSYAPDIDIRQTDNEVLVSIEISGMDQKDLKVSVRDNVLTLKGEKKKEETTENTTFLVNERCYGLFERSFTLPADIQADKVTAQYKNGVLVVTLPKAEEVKPKEISVKVA